MFLANAPGAGVSTSLPDIGLGYLATALRKSNHEVFISQREKDRNLVSFVKEFRRFDPDLVGFKVYSLQVKYVKEAINRIKQLRSNVTIVLGGPHVSAMGADHLARDFLDVDFFVVGEGEFPLLNLVDRLEQNLDISSIPGLVFRNGDRIIKNPKMIEDDVNVFGMPAWDLIPPQKYMDRWHFWAYQLPSAPILTSRGCPYRCAFCAQDVISGKKFRQRSLDLVFEEMTLLYMKYGVREFDILDDNF